MLGVGCDGPSPPGAADGRPSFLVLVTDDQRADTLGCMGNPVIRTPSIDALAADGVIFDQAFVTTSSCPSSRASIFTGQYMSRHGIDSFDTPLSVAALEHTYPLVLRAAGYRTGFLGKWGLGGPMPWPAFDHFGGFPGQGTYFDEADPERRHLTAVMADQAIDFFEQDDGRPFCLQISFKAPHGPWYFDPALADLYEGQEMPLGETATAEAVRRMDEFLRKSMVGNRGEKWLGDPVHLQERVREYYRMISGVDAAVGRMAEALERLGIADRVVVLYTSDNGLLVGEHGFVGKALMQEESIRVPLIVRDGRLPPELRGRRVQEMALNIDLAPTLLDMAGVAAPPEMQGRSLARLVRGDEVAWREDWFYEFRVRTGYGYFPTLEGVRTRDWKYVRYLDPELDSEVLYDLRSDPRETVDRARDADVAEVLEDMRRRWEAYRAEVA